MNWLAWVEQQARFVNASNRFGVQLATRRQGLREPVPGVKGPDRSLRSGAGPVTGRTSRASSVAANFYPHHEYPVVFATSPLALIFKGDDHQAKRLPLSVNTAKGQRLWAPYPVASASCVKPLTSSV